MKKHLSLLLAAVMAAASVSSITASAAEEESKDFVIFGDSIAAGVLRNGNVDRNYGNILADYYHGTDSNYAVSGADSDDLLSLVKSLSADQKKSITDAECVVISIGGNDILHYACKDLLVFFADKKFLNAGFTADDIPQEPTVNDIYNMTDTTKVREYASASLLNAAEVIGVIRKSAGNLRFDNKSNEGYIKNHIMVNIKETVGAIKEINPNAKVIVQNIYQPLQIDYGFLTSTFESSYTSVVSQLRDVLEGVMSSFNTELVTASKAAGFDVADILTDFTSMEAGVTQSTEHPGHASYFVDIQTDSLATADFHPNTIGHVAIAAKIIDVIGEKHNDGGLLSDTFENYAKKDSYPAGALETYNAAAGTWDLGDVNFDGTIDGRDATIVLTEYAKTSANQDPSFRYREVLAAKVTNDDVLDGRDATTILTYYAKSSTDLNMSFKDYLAQQK